MQEFISVFYILVLLISVILHEMAHGYAALSQGDTTALYAGRLTFNPIKHLDFWGSFAIPLMLIVSGTGFVIGWAKPVPYNPDNLRNKKWGKVWVASAGVLTNLGIALVFSAILHIVPLPPQTADLISIVVITNIVLALFNLLPIPPLDGSKIILAFVPDRFQYLTEKFERYGFIILLVFVIYGFHLLEPLIFGLFNILVP